MSIFLLGLIAKWVNFGFVSMIVFFGYADFTPIEMVSENNNMYKNLNVAYQIEPFSTKIVYQTKLPRGIEKIVVEGQEGVTAYSKVNQDGTIVVERINQVKHVGTGFVGEFTGSLTGYGPDCRGCNGRGFVACRDNKGKYHNLIKDGIYYDDHEHGEIRIVAAPSGQLYEGGPSFRCGTIVEIKSNKLEIIAIVLDRGGALQSKLANDKILLDLAFESEAEQLTEIRSITQRGTVKFSVKRWGF